jgi:hypothetical protein
MSVTITKNTPPAEIEKKLKKAQPKPMGLDTGKYFGKVKWKEDHLKFQQELRGE